MGIELVYNEKNKLPSIHIKHMDKDSSLYETFLGLFIKKALENGLEIKRGVSYYDSGNRKCWESYSIDIKDPLSISKEIDGIITSTDRPPFVKVLENLINSYSKETKSDTPDFILAEYLNNCLSAFDLACNKRESWYDASTKKHL